MGNNESTVSGCVVTFHNTTQFPLRISLDHRNFINQPWNNRVTVVEQVCTQNLFINIKMLTTSATSGDSNDKSSDAEETAVKEASFFAQRQHSWIVTDAAIRRRQPGSPTYVADVTSPEMELINNCVYQRCVPWERHDTSILYSFFRDERETSWLVRPVKKYKNWIQEKPSVDSGSVPDAVSGVDVDIELGNAAAVANSSQPVQAVQPTAHFFIVNESSYFLDITVEYFRSSALSGSKPEKSEVRHYCSDPRITTEFGRVVGIDSSEDRYPMVRIVAIRSGGSIAKRAEFYTDRTFSWLITDECIARAVDGNPAKLSSWTSLAYTDADVAPGGFHGGAGCLEEKWRNANQYKRHNWVSA